MELGRLGTARCAVLTIIDEEFEAAAACLETHHNVPHTPYYCQAEGQFDMVVRQAADRSQVPAAGATRQTLEDYRPEVLILVGIAGGIADRQGVGLGDVVVPNYLHYSEFRKLTSEGDLRRYASYDHPSISILDSYVHPIRRRDEWLAEIDLPRPDGSAAPPQVVIGSLVAGEKLYGDPSHQEQRLVVSRHEDAVAVDMESFGVARAVAESRRSVDYNPRLLIVRGVSDLVRAADEKSDPSESTKSAEDNSEQREKWRPYAAAAASAFAAAVVKQVLESTDPRARLRTIPGSGGDSP